MVNNIFNMSFKKVFQVFSILVLLSLAVWPLASAQAQSNVTSNSKPSLSCLVYFTGVGCPHCARTDPVVLGSLLKEDPRLVVIEYEIYRTPSNTQYLKAYDSAYKLPAWQQGIPTVFLGKDKKDILVGDGDVLQNVKSRIKDNTGQCLLPDGSVEQFSRLKINYLLGHPKIWRHNRILVKEKQGQWLFAWNGASAPRKDEEEVNESNVLSSLIEDDNFLLILSSLHYKTILKGFTAPLSGKEVHFAQAVRFHLGETSAGTTTPTGGIVTSTQKMTVVKVISLAAVDAINPCALAVLLLMLMTIMMHTSNRKRKIIMAGLSFILAIFVIYFLYGLLIVRFFQVAQVLAPVKLWLYKILGGLAALIGLLDIKDFIYYRPGGLGTEMPLFMRPKAKRLMSRVTSPAGAFLIGTFVTVFLLPCTIGPYFIAGGILSSMSIVKTIPWLLLYNFVFILPMLAVVFLVYGGLENVKDVAQWKDKNIRKIHLAEGIIMLGLGILMLLGIA